MRHLLDTLGGLYQLVRLAALTRFNLRGAYWQWRMHTALGSEAAEPGAVRRNLRSVMDYARWVHRMRRGV
jgi:hypothetical protein